MADRTPTKGRGHALPLTAVARILTAILGILLLAGALVYVFSARLVLTPTLTCEVKRPSLCRVWVSGSPDPVIAAVFLVIAVVALLMAITGRGWMFSFAGASLAPAGAEATGMSPEDMPPNTVPVPVALDVSPDPARPGPRASTSGALPGVALFTSLPDEIRGAAAAKWASWYPDSPIGVALQEIREVPGQRDGSYFLRLSNPLGEDRWLRVSPTESRRAW